MITLTVLLGFFAVLTVADLLPLLSGADTAGLVAPSR